MKRIGRSQTPYEAALTLALENPAVLDRMARNLYAERRDTFGIFAEQDWQTMRESRRETYRTAAVKLLRARIP